MDNMVTEKTKILVADGRELFRSGLAYLLSDQSDQYLAFSCSTGRDAIDKAAEIRPQIMLMDIEDGTHGELDAVETIHQIANRSPQTRIMVLTHCVEEEKLADILKAGARGCLSKDIRVDDLLKALMLVIESDLIVSSPIAPLIENPSMPENHKVSLLVEGEGHEVALTTRELEVLRIVASGATNREVADRLYITESTVKVHLRNAMEKLHVRNRTEAASVMPTYDVNWQSTGQGSTL